MLLKLGTENRARGRRERETGNGSLGTSAETRIIESQFA